MFTKSSIYNGTVSLIDYLRVKKHRYDTRDYIHKYHSRVSEMYGMKYAFSFGSGRGALYAILKSIGVQGGDEVIIQGYTCVAVPKAIIYAGAKPVYADISLDDYSMTVESMNEVFSPKTRAVVIQHTYGIPCRAIDDILLFCREKGVCVIEDCAHTFCNTYGNRILGTIGDAAFISTDHSKYISTCVGGLAITNDDVIGEKLKSVYSDSEPLKEEEIDAIVCQLKGEVLWKNKYVRYLQNANKLSRRIIGIIQRLLRVDHSTETYWLDDYSNFSWPKYTFPGKLSNIQAYMGIIQLGKYKKNYYHRKQITGIYVSLLHELKSGSEKIEAPLMYPIIVENPDEVEKLLSDVTEVGRWFQNEILCIPKSEYSYIGFKAELCPRASFVAARIVNLPNHMHISISEAEQICRILIEKGIKSIETN